MPPKQRVSGFAIFSLLTTCYWIVLTTSLWLPLPEWTHKPLLIAYLGCGLLFSASLLLPLTAASIEFSLNPRKRGCSSDGVLSVFDRVHASVTVAFAAMASVFIPFGVAFVLAVLGMHQAGRNRPGVRGYTLATACCVACCLGALLFLAGNIRLAQSHSEAAREESQCRENVGEMATALEVYAAGQMRFPGAESWLEAALGSPSVPSDASLECPSGRGMIGVHAYNERLGRGDGRGDRRELRGDNLWFG